MSDSFIAAETQCSTMFCKNRTTMNADGSPPFCLACVAAAEARKAKATRQVS